MGFTSGKGNAGSDDSPYLYIFLHNKEHRSKRFPDNPGNDMVNNKGDLWEFSLSSFNFQKTCITKGDISKVIIQEGGNDGWHIKSVVTMVHSGSKYKILTVDLNVNRWIDGNGSSAQRELLLTKQK